MVLFLSIIYTWRKSQGTALNKILKDIIVKYKTLRGYSAP